MNSFSNINRRLFLRQISISAAAALTSPVWAENLLKKGDIRIGYSAITWGGKDEQAIK